ncbi:MAG: diguanylate cyclase [Lachnospiraceae bacterium]|nr:diguanylate cyclase [Lachnospiraceae bacterium]
MKDRLDRLRDIVRFIGKRFIGIALAVLIVIIAISVFVGFRFFTTKKEALLLQGELNAKESAMEYERYLLTQANVMTLTACTVDDMLEAGDDNEAIEKYITDKTRNIIEELGMSTTGLYGWINGEYMDGAGWTPDEGYVPTERPWYTQALYSGKRTTFVEPYLDLQTNTVMVTIACLLDDGESVVAMDVSLESIQQIVEKIASTPKGSQGFVIDENGVVIVHSDETQIGANYLEQEDGLGAEVARKLLRDGDNGFDIKTQEGSFSVYSDELEGGWHSVSLINADIWYRSLRIFLVAFPIALALAVAVMISVFLHVLGAELDLMRLSVQIYHKEMREEELQTLSETDRMTGLNDRVSGKRKVDELLTAESEGMFLELDIDHFKSINDTYGHQVGDSVILAVAEALRNTFRTYDIIMRLGGDEFGVFAVGIANRELGESIIGRLFARIDNLKIPELGGEKVCISVGAMLRSGRESVAFEELYAGADEALYISKKTRGNSLTFRE